MSQVDNGHPGFPERRDSDGGPPARAYPSVGRRKTDFDPRITITKKLLVILVAVLNVVYLAAETTLRAINVCP